MSGKTVVLNGARINYDGKIDLSALADEADIYDVTAPEQIAERIRGAEVVVMKEMPLSAETIAQFPDSVKMICEASIGYDNIDLAAAKAKGIIVCNVPVFSAQRVAHTAVMMMLNLASSMQVQIAMLAKGDKSNFTKCLQVDHTELNGKVLGVVGAGNIGKEVIKIGQAMGMRVITNTRSPREDQANLRYVTLDTLLKKSDYITLHCPLTEETYHMINAETLAMMKPNAFVINTARGGLVDEAALAEALKQGVIAGAGLDVQENEPPAEDSPLYELPNVIMTPHMGWKAIETRQRLVTLIAGNIKAFHEGKPINVVS